MSSHVLASVFYFLENLEKASLVKFSVSKINNGKDWKKKQKNKNKHEWIQLKILIFPSSSSSQHLCQLLP